MLLDLAHASQRTIDDALAIARRPVVVSHTGVKGTCDNARNLSDAQLAAWRATGGLDRHRLLGDRGLRERDADAIARAIRHAVSVAGHRPRGASAPTSTARCRRPSTPPASSALTERCWPRASRKATSRR